MRHINFKTAVNVVSEIVAEKGNDYVYPGSFYDDCKYWDFDEQEPSCLVGHFFYNTALISTQDDFLLIENSTSDQAIVALERWGRATFSPAAENFLYAVQNRQDAGWDWGRSLEFAYAAARAIEDGDVEDVHDAIQQTHHHDENVRTATRGDWGWES